MASKFVCFVAVGYPAALAGLVLLLLHNDPYTFFDERYLFSTLVVLPAGLLAYVVFIAKNCIAQSVAVNLGIWTLIVTVAHFVFLSWLYQGV